MSIIDTLITDRTLADVERVKALRKKGFAAMTSEERSEFLAPVKGAYNATDLNRVQEAMEYLAERFRGYGYNVPEIKRPSIQETVVTEGTSRLPEGYTELEHIQSTGEQCIDTEFAPNQDSRVVFRGEFPITADTQWLFGARVGNGSAMFGFLEYQSQFRFDYGTTNNYFNNADTVTSVDTNKNNVVVNGSEILSAASQTFSSGYNLLLFANNNAGTVSGHATDAKCSGCQIYDNGTLVRDYVPCLNPSNEVGLYDTVTKMFFGNAGTGYFLPGPAVSLPTGYTRLDYIQSSGTQFADTGVNVKSTSGFYVDFALLSASGTHGIIGGFTYGGYNNNFAAYGGNWYAQYGNNKTHIFGTTDTNRHTVSQNVTSGAVIFDGETVATGLTFYDNTARTFRLFCYNGGDDYPAFWPGTFKLYSCAMYDNGIVVRLYTPVLTDSSEVGLYDSINGVFYGNAGTGSFVAGEELGSSDGDGDIPTQIIERDYWEIGDIPRKDQMDLYLSNLSLIRSINDVMKSTPEVPGDMEGLLHTEANDIEQILIDVDYLLSVMVLNWFYTAEVFCGEV